MMKKLYLLLIGILFLSISLRLKGAIITSAQTGNWDATATWVGGIIPVSVDDVIIANSFSVTVNSTQNCKTITINSGGTLDLKSGRVLTTTATITVSGTLTVEDGTLNAGDGGSDFLYIDGGNLNFSGGTINVAGRYKQYGGGNANLSGTGIINISTAGVQSASYHSFAVQGSGAFSVVSGSTVQIVLKYGNSGSATELYYSPTTSNFFGGSIVVENASGLSDIYIDSDEPIYKIESKVGSGKTFHFAIGCNFNLTNFIITSGLTQADANSKINITGTTSLGGSANLTLASGASVIFSVAPAETINVERDLTMSAWHYIAAPVNDTRNFAAILGANLVSGDYFYRFDEASANDGTWVQIFPTGGSGAMTETFNSGHGYAIEYNSSVNTISFNGIIRSGDVTYPLTRTGSSANNGYNLVGNPYQATIIANNDVNSLLAVNSFRLDATNNAIYLWDQSISDYTAISNADSKTRIAVGQGFMVRALNGGETFTFKTTMQENGTNTFFKGIDKENWVRTRFTVSNDNGLLNEILIGFNDNMTNGLDISYDAGKLKGNPNIALYSYLEDGSQSETGFVTQTLPPFLIKPVSVKVGYDVKTPGEFIFKLKDFEFSSDSTEIEKATIELEDQYTNKIVDLKNQDYAFYVDKAGTTDNRFILHFNRNLLKVNNHFAINNDYLIYSKNDRVIVIKNIGIKSKEISDICIISMAGMILYENNQIIPFGTSLSIKTHINTRVVVVRVTNNKQVTNKKIVLN